MHIVLVANGLLVTWYLVRIFGEIKMACLKIISNLSLQSKRLLTLNLNCCCQCHCQNMLLIGLIWLIIFFSSSIYATEDKNQLLSAATDSEKLQEPYVLKHPVLIGSLSTDDWHGWSVAVNGDYAYVGGDKLEIINISILSAPVLVGSYSYGRIYAIAVKGNYAYVGTGGGKCELKILNVANPQSPILIGELILVGELESNSMEELDLRVVGDYVYFVSSDGFEIINITNPTTPFVVGSFRSCKGRGIAISGDYAYTGGSGGFFLNIFDITTPTLPILVGKYQARNADGVAVVGDYVYIAADEDYHSLQIINVATPTKPVLVGSLELGEGKACGVVVIDEYAYVTVDGTSGGKLKIINVANPTKPVLFGDLVTNDGAYGIEVVGNYAYVSTSSSLSTGLKIIRVKNNSPIVSTVFKSGTKDATVMFSAKDFADKFSDIDGDKMTKIQMTSLPNDGILKLAGIAVAVDQEIVAEDLGNLTFEPKFNWTGSSSFYWKGYDGFGYSTKAASVNISVVETVSPVWVGSLGTGGTADGVVVTGKYAFVTDRYKGLKVIDISTKTKPVVVGSLYIEGEARGITVVEDYAYVAAFDGGLKIIDIAKPSAPVYIGSLDTDGSAYAVTVVEDYAYVADKDKGLKIIDITSPSNPVLVGSLDTDGDARGVSVVDEYAYLADWDGGLKIVDITNKKAPKLISSLKTNGSANDVIVVGGYAYVADWDKGLTIVDITNKTKPVLIGNIVTVGQAMGVKVVDDYAYVADGVEGGLKIINVATPKAPVLVGGVDTSNEAHGVTAVKNYAYLADGEKGLEIIRVQNDPPVVSNVAKSGIEGAVVTFSTTDFSDNFFDVDGYSLAKIKVMSLPTNGFLKLSDSNIVIGQEVVVKDIHSMTFNPAANWYGSTSFNWKGSDEFVYSDNAAGVKITLVVIEDSKESNGSQESEKSFCEKNWWLCYVVPTCTAALAAVGTATVSIVLYAHKKKMCCFRQNDYVAIN